MLLRESINPIQGSHGPCNDAAIERLVSDGRVFVPLDLSVFTNNTIFGA
jgi:hypothetical protein